MSDRPWSFVGDGHLSDPAWQQRVPRHQAANKWGRSGKLSPLYRAGSADALGGVDGLAVPADQLKVPARAVACLTLHCSVSGVSIRGVSIRRDAVRLNRAQAPANGGAILPNPGITYRASPVLGTGPTEEEMPKGPVFRLPSWWMIFGTVIAILPARPALVHGCLEREHLEQRTHKEQPSPGEGRERVAHSSARRGRGAVAVRL